MSYDQLYTIDQNKIMPAPKSNLSTTSHTRLLAALPSKAYMAMHLILGGDAEARVKINNLARALVLEFFLNELEGKRFLTESEIESLVPMMEVPTMELGTEDWEQLAQTFKDRGQGDPESTAYIVNAVTDLIGTVPETNFVG